MTGRLYVPLLTFIYQNVIANISSFYGSTNHLYHLVQSLPIMLFPYGSGGPKVLLHVCYPPVFYRLSSTNLTSQKD